MRNGYSAISRWGFSAVLLLAAVLYYPGLSGGYFFDDDANIVGNMHLRVDSLDYLQWWQAAWSSPSSELQRPLGSVSFALNYFVGGLNPWPMKATNLAIHLLNGFLLYLLLRFVRRLRPDRIQASRNQWLALIVSAAWLLHPINLTSVLYVVQRMESLAQVFVFTGLLFYVDARVRQQTGRAGSGWLLWAGFPLALILGVMSKESAALLPVYALILEVTLIGISGPVRQRNITVFFCTFLLAPAIVGLIWLLPRVLSSDAFAGRSFTLMQRLLTEPRILMDYVSWILFPVPSAFTFYHDTVAISTSWLAPWTTIASIFAIVAMLVTGVILRQSRPLFALGIFWFFAAHLMTATVIPLELVFEHRNYFASAGLLLAAVDLILPCTNTAQLAFARKVLLGAFITLCGFSLSLRAHEWSDPLSLALAEATRHPDSPRATYEYGRTLVVLSGYRPNSPLVSQALDELTKSSKIKGSGILAEVGMIMVASRTGREIDASWWRSIREKLASQPPSASDDEALKSLTQCQREGRCVVDDNQMLQVYLAAMRDGTGTPASLYSYAIFAYGRLHDPELALRLVTEAADKSRDPQYRLNLINFLISQGKRKEALEQLSLLKKQDRLGRLASDTAQAEQQLSALP